MTKRKMKYHLTIIVPTNVFVENVYTNIDVRSQSIDATDNFNQSQSEYFKCNIDLT